MDNKYNKFFYDSFCGEDYSNTEHWTAFFGGIADKIIEIFAPKTVLDAGCASGYLVSALRERGVEAWGFDISSYAIESAPDAIKPYLCVQSMTDPLPDNFPKRYDVAVTIEVLEHMFPEEGAEAIRLLTGYSDNVIFSSTPSDIDNRTHVNVQQAEYWAKEFSKNSFYRNLMQPMDFISQQAVLFQKKDYVPNVIFDYENLIRITKRETANKKLHVANIFFDTGSGFSEADKATFNYDASVISSERIPVPTNTVKVRFDAIENSYCLISNFKAFTNLGEIKIEEHNGFLTTDGTYVFTHCDPSMSFNVESQPVMWIQFYADILVMENANELMFANEYIKNYNNSMRLADELKKQSASYEVKLSEQESILQSKEESLAASNEELAKKKSQIDALTDELSSSTDALAESKADVEHKNEQIEKLNSVVEGQATDIKNFKSEIVDLQEKNISLTNQSATVEKQYQATVAELDHYKTHYFAAINQRTELQARVAELEGMYSCISRSACWKMTKPLRLTLDIIKKPLRKIKLLRLMRKGLRCYRENGFKYTWNKFKEKLHRTKNNSQARRPLYTEAELESQRNEKFEKDIKFSILVPLYNTPEKFLCEMIESVVAQTYSNWELCLADGSDGKHRDVEHICKKYAKHDERIRYKKLEKNLGISGNTNACIDMATGDYISLFDHDDLLHPAALHDVMVEICEKGADFIYTDENTFSKTPADAYCPHFKPDYAPDTLRTNNYICHFTTFKASLIDEVGKFRSECDGSQDYDMVLRLTEKAKNIVHIPKILYYWRAHAASVATDISAKPYVITAAHKALSDHLRRTGLNGTVEDTVVPSMYKIKYEIANEDLVSIIIANKDHTDDLDKCLRSIKEKTTYQNYEIIVVENNSTERETWDYYEAAKKEFGIKLVVWTSPTNEFNYSAINNFGVRQSDGKYVILLNNDTEIISPEWIEEMLMFAQREDIGAVGAKLYYPDNTIQHAGIGIGLLTLAGHYHKNFPKGHPGYMGRLIYAHNVSAVTAACIMIPRKVWDEVDGLDETFKVAFNDVDLCMRIRQSGYLIVFTPFAELYHYESKSRGLDSAPEKRERFVGEVTRFQKRWRKELDAGDPYYNPNFSLDKEDFSIK